MDFGEAVVVTTASPNAAPQSAALARGQAELERVLVHAERGKDPFQQQPMGKAKLTDTADTVHVEDADVAAFERFLHRYKHPMLLVAYVVAQASSWVLMKGALTSMHTPAVLTFLHLLSSAALQLVLASYGLLEQPKIAVSSVRGASVAAATNGLQVLLVMAVLSYSSVYMLLCCITVAPLLLGYSPVAQISSSSSSSKSWICLLPPQMQLPLGLACSGLIIELMFDQHKSIISIICLMGWCATVVLQHVWRQVKVDATLGHKIMDPDFLFRARQASDFEDASTTSTLMFMSSVLPACPILLLGFLCLEGKDLVDHEPSVPTLTVLLISCLASATANNLKLLITSPSSSLHGHNESGDWQRYQDGGLSMAVAAFTAVLLVTMGSPHNWSLISLLGASAATAGSITVHWMQQGHKFPVLSRVSKITNSNVTKPVQHES